MFMTTLKEGEEGMVWCGFVLQVLIGVVDILAKKMCFYRMYFMRSFWNVIVLCLK